jgi:hypothetical protein
MRGGMKPDVGATGRWLLSSGNLGEERERLVSSSAKYSRYLGGKANKSKKHARSHKRRAHKKASRKVHRRKHRGGSQQTCGPVAPQAGAQCNSGSAHNYAEIMVGHADAQLQSAQQKMYS